MKNKDTLRYIAGACFAAEALLSVISFVNFGFSFWGLLSLAGYALISVSMFLTMPVLTTVGGVISLVAALILFFQNTIAPVIRIFGGIFSFLKNFIYNLPFILSNFGYSFITSILNIALWVIILIIGFKKEKAKQLGLAAGIVAALRCLIIIISIKAQSGVFRLSFRWLLFNHISLFLIIGAILIGYVSANMPVKAASNPSASAGDANAVSSRSQTDRLVGIKKLLDSGVITQEEFDEKKKQILGS